MKYEPGRLWLLQKKNNNSKLECKDEEIDEMPEKESKRIIKLLKAMRNEKQIKGVEEIDTRFRGNVLLRYRDT